ncbi:MAG: hypothetical protein FWF69_07140 [Firmicutes bacterium]|nr:hypothetical protein [Bacillota bacterium]
MANAVEFVSFALKKGASVPDFLLASEKMNSGSLSRLKGYVSRKLLVHGETWADLVIWETMEDALNAAKTIGEYDAARAYFSFLDEKSVDMRHFFVEKSY